MAARSFSSWTLRFWRTPTNGCELLVMVQLFTGWRYERAGILALERYLPA